MFEWLKLIVLEGFFVSRPWVRHFRTLEYQGSFGCSESKSFAWHAPSACPGIPQTSHLNSTSAEMNITLRLVEEKGGE